MTAWQLFVDSPLARSLYVTIPVVVVGTIALFSGRAWGRSEAPAVLQESLRKERRKVMDLTAEVSRLRISTDDLLDTKRSTIGAAHYLETVAEQALSRVRDAARKVREATDQPSEERRKAQRVAV